MRISRNKNRVQSMVSVEPSDKIDAVVSKIKEISFAKFDESIDLAINLNIDTKKSDQIIRGVVSLPYGVGKEKRVLAVCVSGDEEKCLHAGASYAGGDELIKKIEDGFCDFDIIVTVPSMMVKLMKLGKILGPKGLMPNMKNGGIATDIEQAIRNFKNGQIEYRADKSGIIHNSIGRVSFTVENIVANVQHFIAHLISSRPVTVKGNFIKSIYLSSTMGRSFLVDIRSLNI